MIAKKIAKKLVSQQTPPDTGLKFYREPNGDYLAIDVSSNDYYKTNLNEDSFEGRATVATGLGSGINTTAISREYLAGCQEVPQSAVPQEWLEAFGY